jgi:alpha-tubulin suppressor-like RCC1 family protein
MGKKAVAIAAGGDHTCALLNDGSVKCWGYNVDGQLGQGDTDNRGDGPNEMGDKLLPVDLGSGKTASAIAAGRYHTCARLTDGSVKCWGNGFFGQIGSGDFLSLGDEPGEMGDKLLAVDLGTGKTASAIAAGFLHTCAILSDGSVKCWGYNDFGQLGLGNSVSLGNGPNQMGNNLLAVDLGTGKTASAIDAGYAHTCALLNDGSVKCWGINGFGQLGKGNKDFLGNEQNEMGNSLLAIELGTGKTASGMTVGWNHTCALLNDGSVKCWGNNDFGQLGQGDPKHRGDDPNEMGNNLPAIELGTGKTAAAVTACDHQTCALLNDGSVKCWGANGVGQLGLGNTNNRGDEPGEMGDKLPTTKLFSPFW